MRPSFLLLSLLLLAGDAGAAPTPTPTPGAALTGSPTGTPVVPPAALEDEAHATLVRGEASTPQAEAPPTGTATPGRDSLIVVPSPLGDKVVFRAVLSRPATVTVSVHDHFYAPVTVLTKAGSGCFDLLWKLRRVPEGIYYYEARFEGADGSVVKLPVQKVVVTR